MFFFFCNTFVGNITKSNIFAVLTNRLSVQFLEYLGHLYLNSCVEQTDTLSSSQLRLLSYNHYLFVLCHLEVSLEMRIIVGGAPFAQTAYGLTVETDECTSSTVMRILQSNLLSVMLD